MKGRKYIALRKYLEDCGNDEVVLTLKQISDIVGVLPPSAYDYAAPWYDGHGGPLSVNWVNAGYTSSVKWNTRTITFTKVGTPGTVKPVRSQITRTSLLEVNTALQSIRKYHETTADKKHTRFRSWEHCYSAFRNNRSDNNKVDFLCLHLAWYLASWGMLRNSFLLNHDYLVHRAVVRELTRDRYMPLFNNDHTSDIIPLTLEASKAVAKSYPGNSVSSTLITKILLGVFGCAPAYDRFFKYTATKYKVCSAQWGERSLKSLWQYYEKHQEIFERARDSMPLDGFFYTPMKLLDMCLWQIGYDESPRAADD